jgi:hypothetical protein
MNELIIEWGNKRMIEGTNEWKKMTEWMNACMHAWMNERTNEWVNESLKKIIHDWNVFAQKRGIKNNRYERVCIKHGTDVRCWYGGAVR